MSTEWIGGKPEYKDPTKIVWGDWKKHFAFLPTNVNNEIVWFESYYERKGRSEFLEATARGTLFDILKDEK